jgi:hypothetical protein
MPKNLKTITKIVQRQIRATTDLPKKQFRGYVSDEEELAVLPEPALPKPALPEPALPEPEFIFGDIPADMPAESIIAPTSLLDGFADPQPAFAVLLNPEQNIGARLPLPNEQLVGTGLDVPKGPLSLFHAAALAVHCARKQIAPDPVEVISMQIEYDSMPQQTKDRIARDLRMETICHCKMMFFGAQDVVSVFCDDSVVSRYLEITASLMGLGPVDYRNADEPVPMEFISGMSYVLNAAVTVVDSNGIVLRNFMPRLANANHIILRMDGADYVPLIGMGF